MLPAECGLVSRRCPLIDTAPNAVGLKYKSSSPSPRGHDARRAPQPISNPSFHAARLPFTPLHLSCLPIAHNLRLRPRRLATLRAISYLPQPASPAPLSQPASNCVFSSPS